MTALNPIPPRPAQRHEPPSLSLKLDRLRDRFDALCSELAGGVRGPAHFDALEERAQGIAADLRAAFRSR